MLASRRAAGALVLSFLFLSCARGSGPVEGSPFGVVAPLASASPTGDTAMAGAQEGPPDDPAANADAADENLGVTVVTEDDADLSGDDANPGANTGDDAADEAALDPLPPPPLPGDLAITEVMISPSGPEPDSEWFEIYNGASSPRLLSGLTIEDGYGDTHVIASTPPVVIPSGSSAVLVRDAAAAAQALVPASSIVYAYGTGLAWYEGLELDAGDAGELSLWRGETLLADVPYGMWDAAWIGQSIELASPTLDASDPGSWCHAESPWTAGSDEGTPGAASDCGPL